MLADVIMNATGRTYWCCDHPIDVADVEDLTVDSFDLGVSSLELDWDGGIPKVGSHCEVRNGSNKTYSSSDVVEDPVLPWLGEAGTHEAKGTHRHNSSDSPVNVGSASGDVDVGGSRVVELVGIGVQGFVRPGDELTGRRHLDWRVEELGQ